MRYAIEYIRRAAKYREQAKLVRHPKVGRQFEELAMICLRLAQLTESDLIYEPEPPKLTH
jgi:hypothetical protein